MGVETFATLPGRLKGRTTTTSTATKPHPPVAPTLQARWLSGMKSRCLFVLLLVCLGSSTVLPCTCGGPNQARSMRDVAEWYATRPDVALIFEGKVVRQEVRGTPVGSPSAAMSITPSGKHRVVEFDVARVFRGSNQPHLSVVSGLGTGDCGYMFWPGESYLVYASSGPRGLWFTSICSGTTSIEDSGTAVRFLTGEKPTAEDLLSPPEYQRRYSAEILPKRTGSVCGHVLKPDGSPLKGANVELWEPFLHEDRKTQTRVPMMDTSVLRMFHPESTS
jgi:hypothetical protein